MSGRTAGQEGFTLLEMMIVTTVLAIIMSIGVPGYRSALRTARITKATQELRTISMAIDSFRVAEAGELPLTPRKGDYLQAEVALLNEAVGHIGEHAARMRAVHRELCVRLADAVAAPGMPSDGAARQRLQAVTDAARALEVELQQFQRSDEVAAVMSPDVILSLAAATTATATR